jgi:hypothetical protein
MKIASDMFDHYLDKLTFQWFADHDLPPDDLSEYDEKIVTLFNDAQQHNDLEPFRLAMDWILLNPDKYSLEDHGNFPFLDEEVRDILRYVRRKIYPEAPPPDRDEVEDVEIVPQSRFEWWEQREREGRFDPSRVVTNGPAQWVVDFNRAVAEGRRPLLPGEVDGDTGR